jgi:nucleoside-diphosphate-sugar epimerase
VRALVTGAGGFVGAHLAARLVEDGWHVTGTVRPGRPAWRLAALGIADDVDVLEADLSDPVAAAGAAGRARPDVAFLLAAARDAGTADARAATAAVNGTSAVWLVDALSDQCGTVVRLGSSTEYGEVAGPMDEASPLRPRGFFGATKAAGSLLTVATAARRGMRSSVLRAFQVYGPHDHPGRLVPTALRAARTGTSLALTGPGRRRDWVYVDDVVEACVRVATAGHLPPGQVLNIGTGRQVTNEELVAEVERVTGRGVRVAVGEHGGREWDAASWVCDPSLARELLGWEAKVDLTDGLARCWAAEASEGP